MYNNWSAEDQQALVAYLISIEVNNNNTIDIEAKNKFFTSIYPSLNTIITYVAMTNRIKINDDIRQEVMIAIYIKLDKIKLVKAQTAYSYILSIVRTRLLNKVRKFAKHKNTIYNSDMVDEYSNNLIDNSYLTYGE